MNQNPNPPPSQDSPDALSAQVGLYQQRLGAPYRETLGRSAWSVPALLPVDQPGNGTLPQPTVIADQT